MMPKRITFALAIAFVAVLCITGLLHAQGILSQYCGNPAAGGIVENVAPWYCKYINPSIISEWHKYFPLMMVAVMFSYSIAAVLFMFGVAFRNDRLRTFGTGELYEATATAMMAILFVFISAVMFGILPAVTAGPINPFDASLTYIATTLNTTYTTASHVFYLGTLGYSYTSFKLEGEVGGFNFPTIPPVWALAFQYLFFWPSWVVVAFMFEAMLSLYTQFYLIIFFMYAAIPVFLVPGIIFRALIPTRNLGGMMIAMAIGFYFIMPTLFSIAYYYTSTNIYTQLSQSQTALNRYGASPSGLIDNSLSASAPLVSTIGQLQSTFGAFWLSILFFPALIIALTYALVTQIAEILGGMAKTSGRLRTLV